MIYEFVIILVTVSAKLFSITLTQPTPYSHFNPKIATTAHSENFFSQIPEYQKAENYFQVCPEVLISEH